jgi:hypothetical protein
MATLAIGECRFGAGSGISRVFWLVGHQSTRLALRADSGRSGDTDRRARGRFASRSLHWPRRPARTAPSSVTAGVFL